MKRALHKLVKWIYFLIALTVILLAVLVQSGRSFSHLVDDYEQGIASYLSNKLNAQVEIGRIQAEWNGLKPSLLIENVTINSQADLPIAAFKEARLRLDIIGSLLNARIVWSNLILTQVDMAFMQTADGFWHIPGLPRASHAATKADRDDKKPKHAQLDALVDMLLLSTRIEFQRSHLRFQFSSGQDVLLDSPYLLLENSADFHRLSLQIDVDEQPRSVYLVLEGQGDPRDETQFRSKGYLQLNRFPTSEPVAAASAFLLSGSGKSALQSEGMVDANIWFESRAGGQGYDLNGRLELQRLSLPVGARRLALDDFSSELTGFWLPTGEWRLGVQQLKAVLQDLQIEGANLAFSSSGFKQPLHVAMDSLDLERLTQMFTRSGVLAEGKLQEVLSTLAPRGQLRNIHVTLPLQQPKEWQLRANLQQVAVNAWQGAPALTGVDGYLQTGQKGGFVDINSKGPFSMHYAPTFAAPMDYDSARGQVAWHLQPENNQIYVNSGLLEFQKGDELARGYMWLGLPWRRNSGDIDLYLQIGGQKVSASRYQTYTPALLPGSLLSWLEQSVGLNNPGIATQAGFIYRGTLNTKNARARTAQLYLDLKGASLNYHPGWPALTEVDGRLLVSDVHVQASVTSAKVLDSHVEHALVRVNPRLQGRGSLLQVDGQISGLASDGIRVLREGQLRQYLGSSMDSWFMQGAMLARLDLDIPLGTGEDKPLDAHQQVDVDLQAPLFELQNLNLSVNELSGQIRYSSRTGIASTDLKGTFFGEPLAVVLASDKTKGNNKTLIDLQGNVDSQQLAYWSKRPEALFLEGLLPYQARVELNHRSRQPKEQELGPELQGDSSTSVKQFAEEAFATITLKSNLQGVAIDLPAPYGKKASETRPFEFRMWLQEAQSQIQVDYNRDVQALLRMERGRNNQLLNANIALAGTAQLGDKAQFLVSGFLPAIDLDAWKAVQTRYSNYAERLTPVVVSPLKAPQTAQALEQLLAEEAGAVGKLAGLPFRIELVLGQYELGPMLLENLSVAAVPVQAGWQLAVKNPVVEGDLLVPRSPFAPMEVNLAHLSLSAAALGLDDAEAVVDPDSNSEANPARTDLASSDAANTTQTGAPAKQVIDPRKLPLANITVRSLQMDDKHYGNWSLQLRPNNQGVVIDNIRGTIRGVTISGAENLDGAKLIWQHTELGMQSRFIGRLNAGDMGAVLRDWQKPDMLDSRSASYKVDLFWPGSPQDFKVVNLGGEMSIWMEEGRFKRDASAGDGILRLMSILNFDSLARRLRLDFSDLYKSGLAYDTISGKVGFNQGTLVFQEPLVVTTPSSGMQMAGTIDLRREQINTRLVATLPVAGNVTFYAALATGLPAAAGIYLVSKLFKKQVDQATSVSYSIKGSWDDPKMRFDRLFESEQSLRDSVNK